MFTKEYNQKVVKKLNQPLVINQTDILQSCKELVSSLECKVNYLDVCYIIPGKTLSGMLHNTFDDLDVAKVFILLTDESLSFSELGDWVRRMKTDLYDANISEHMYWLNGQPVEIEFITGLKNIKRINEEQSVFEHDNCVYRSDVKKIIKALDYQPFSIQCIIKGELPDITAEDVFELTYDSPLKHLCNKVAVINSYSSNVRRLDLLDLLMYYVHNGWVTFDNDYLELKMRLGLVNSEGQEI